MDEAPSIYDAWLLALTCAAAVVDARTGLIPNWLTLPTLTLAPLAHALHAGPGALGWSLASALLCAAVPLLMFCRGAMGGGDVKLFGASGALAGAHAGLELQLASYVFAALAALCLLAWRGELPAALRRAGRRLFRGRPPGPPGARGDAPRAVLTTVRLGVPVFIACAARLAYRALEL